MRRLRKRLAVLNAKIGELAMANEARAAVYFARATINSLQSKNKEYAKQIIAGTI